MEQTFNSEYMSQLEADRKRVAVEFLNLIGQEKFKEGLRYFSSDAKTHNPYVAGGMEQLTDAMEVANKEGKAMYPRAQFAIKHALADGDLVAVHTELLSDKSKSSEGGLRQMHLFRFEGDKIVEYWDITQQVLPDMPNASAAF